MRFDRLPLRFFFFQAEDGIRDLTVTGVQTCALPICSRAVTAQGLPGTFRFPPVRRPAFDFDPVLVLERFGRAGSWEAWRRDGTINVRSEERRVGEERRSRWSPDH